MAVTVIGCSTTVASVPADNVSGASENSISPFSPDLVSASESASPKNTVSVVTLPFGPAPSVWPGFKECTNDITKIGYKSNGEVCKKLLSALWNIKDKISTDLPEGRYERIENGLRSDDGNKWRLCSYLPIYRYSEFDNRDRQSYLFLKDGRIVDIEAYLKDPNKAEPFGGSCRYDAPNKRIVCTGQGTERILNFINSSVYKNDSFDDCGFSYIREYFKVPADPVITTGHPAVVN